MYDFVFAYYPANFRLTEAEPGEIPAVQAETVHVRAKDLAEANEIYAEILAGIRAEEDRV
jgi:hypothetical protein